MAVYIPPIGVAVGFTSKARAYRSGTAQSVPNNTWAIVQLNAENYDVDGEFDSVTNYRFTAKVEGYYLIICVLAWESLPDASYFYVSIWKNGANVAGTYFRPGSLGNVSGIISDIQHLNAGDYVDFRTFQVSGGSRNIAVGSNLTFMAIHRIS
jgi:hypothetical protein